jgi:hypothetical protein
MYYHKQKFPEWVKRRVGKNNVASLQMIEEKVLYKPWGGGRHAIAVVTQPITVYKSVRMAEGNWSDKHRTVVIPLTLRKGTRIVLHASEAKCRSDKAFYAGEKGICRSHHRWPFMYMPNRVVKAKLAKMEDDCGSGIHFFFSRKRAHNYY